MSDQPYRPTVSETGATQVTGSGLRYSRKITRATPGCIIFLVDQSGSMKDGIAGSLRPKAQVLATAINRFIANLTKECLKGEPRPRHYFDVSVIGYCTDPEGRPIIRPAIQGKLAGRDLVSVVELYDNPLRVEMKEEEQDGELVTKKNYIWYEPMMQGGTPMTQGMYRIHQIASEWVSRHPDSFPPIVIHITDGESTDGDADQPAEALRGLATNDGPLLLFNCHLSDKDVPGLLFPSSEYELPDDWSQSLFRMSSLLPEQCLAMARMKGFDVQPAARGMVLNGDATALIQLIHVGTTIRNDLR